MVAQSTRNLVRTAVDEVLSRSEELARHPELRRKLGDRMQRVSLAAAELIAVEADLDRDIATRVPRDTTTARAQAAAIERGAVRAPAASRPGQATFARAQESDGRQAAVRAAPEMISAAAEAIDFPTFVTTLITGVFQAMTTSTLQQLESYAKLLESVAATTSEFAASNITPESSAAWVTQRFPNLRAERGEGGKPRVSVAPDTELPDRGELANAVGASSQEAGAIDENDLEGTLLPLVGRKLARDRQSLLATMVLMGMQRIVIDEGRIRASMELFVDARSINERAQSSQFDTRVNTGASAAFGNGLWGASASISATVGYVRNDQQFSRDDIALRAGLRSSVDLTFRTDQVPLDRMASKGVQERLTARARVPETERAGLLTGAERQTASATFTPPPAVPAAPAAPRLSNELPSIPGLGGKS